MENDIWGYFQGGKDLQKAEILEKHFVPVLRNTNWVVSVPGCSYYPTRNGGCSWLGSGLIDLIETKR